MNDDRRPARDDLDPVKPRAALARRQVLAGGAGVMALLALSRVPGAAAASRTSEPQTQPAEGTILQSLNGTWDFLPTTGTPTEPPASGDWAAIPVPAEWNMTRNSFTTDWNAYDLFGTPSAWDSVDVAWYRRTLTVPVAQRGNRIVLRFEAVNFESTVFFNGVQVAHNVEGLLPFEADVTDSVAWGNDNTVHVLVRSGEVASKQSDGWHHPAGSWWGQDCAGIWQDVWLLARTPVHVSDSFVETSVRNSTISVTTTVTNDGTAPATTWVEHVVTDGDRPVLRAVRQVSVPAGGTTTVSFTQDWADPHLWSTEDPHLHQLVVHLLPSQAGKPHDTRTVRFGFREVWVSGTDIYLNGRPIKLRGDSWHYMGSIENSRAYATAWFQMCRQLGVNYLRLHAMPYPPVFYDVADELGLLIVAESGIYGSSGNYALSAADFWDNCATHLTRRVLRDRNHPSVIAWSAENEMLAAFGQSWASKVAALKPVISVLDTSRPIYFEGDGDPMSAGDLESHHYPVEVTTNSTTIPESAYVLAPGESRGDYWDRKKPLLIGEFSSMYYATPSSISAVGGPDAYAGADGFYDAHGLIVGAQIEGFRYAGITGISPWNTVWYGMKPLPFQADRESLPLPEPGGPKLTQVGRYAATLNPGFEQDLPAFQPNAIHTAAARTLQPTAALATDYRTHFWAGSTLMRTYAVYDEVGTDRTVTVEWTLRPDRGRTVKGSRQVAVPAAGKADVTFDVALPAVTRVTSATLGISVSAGGGRLFSDSNQITLYPASVGRRTNSRTVKAAVLETDGSATRDALTALGVTTRPIPDLSSVPAQGEILVLGEGASISPTADQITALTAFVQGGGTVLSFAQRALPNLLPWPVLSSTVPQTIAHVVAPHHPVLADLGPDDLRWWNTDSELVVSSALIKPRFGSVTSLSDVGPGLASSALAEAPYGSGAYLLCQFPVIAAAAKEPIATVLLRNLVDYVATRAVTPAKLGVVSATGSAVPATVSAAEIKSSAMTTLDAASLADIDVLLVDASQDSAAAAVAGASAALNSWLSAGGTLWINGLKPAALGSFAAVLPAGTSLKAVDSLHQHGAVVTGKSAVTDGLNNADLDWPGSVTALLGHTVSATGGTSAVDSRAVSWAYFAKGNEQTKYGRAAESARGFVPGSAVWIGPVGSGRVVVDQLEWAVSLPLPAQTAIVAALAAGLGVGFGQGTGSGLLSTAGWRGFANPTTGAEGNAFDRNDSTRWSSNTKQQPGMYYGVDLGATHTITRIIWDSALSAGDLPPGVDVLASQDGTAYTTVLSLASTAGVSNAGVMTLTLDSVSARYLKFVDTGSTSGTYVSLHELYVFGT
ncbi:sugar-binding domain-containing protein [Actinacidiphila oryziradicis]|uniref:glycoside hydrolase family 2 protein n=1 Tax=Actinacidiphila oryziradicis TaxID=2571141 RepID=UPI0023F1258F|nr:sugar-binding domain-containing protein [Actinacidiphila oryziradicis]MCW2875853.1 glycosyl transferase family 2 [Actinacidiphila oryziradicis]